MSSHTAILSDFLLRAEIKRQIERYVEAIMVSSEPAYHVSHDRAGDSLYQPTPLAISIVQLNQMHDFIMGLDDEVEGEALRAFQHACRRVGIEFSPLVGMVCLNESEDGYLTPEETLNWFVKRVRVCSLAAQE
ncbi:hypothetical protein ACAW63_24070 [Pseudomonas sp. QE6]|uniref:hypothetical protein n=1 Tax=Pseudomonas sp. QE6 TaxID=3242491 RepID=UPI003528F740